MELKDLVTADRIACDDQVSSKKRVLERLSGLLASDMADAAPERIFDSLVARERLGSTGLGHGVALPHARLPGLSQSVGAMLKITHGVDFDAVDNQQVTLIFGLLVPEHSTQAHLETLAQLAERFADDALCARLRNANTAETLLRILCEPTTATSSA